MDTSLGENECHCGMEFTGGDELTQHISTTHTGEFGFVHTKAAHLKPFTKVPVLSENIIEQNIKKICHYQCKLCSFGHEEQTTMKKHMENKHKIKGVALSVQIQSVGGCLAKKKKNKLESHTLI